MPFKFLLKTDEKLKDMRERISKRTGIKGKLLQQIKFAIIPRGLYTKPKYLEDDDVPMELISDGDELLGLDHVNKSRGLWDGLKACSSGDPKNFGGRKVIETLELGLLISNDSSARLSCMGMHITKPA